MNPAGYQQMCGDVNYSGMVYYQPPQQGGGGGGGGAPAPAAQPLCSVELVTRSVQYMRGLATHSYLEVWDSAIESTLEGASANGRDPLTVITNPGNLISVDTKNGVGFPADLINPTYGPVNPISCGLANTVIQDDDLFTTSATYNFAGIYGPNSNSFLGWLINASGLSYLYPSPPPGAFGWYTDVYSNYTPPPTGIPGPGKGGMHPSRR